jgi:ABC-type Fe3+-hydroxamate transport system substrate-binding protein
MNSFRPEPRSIAAIGANAYECLRELGGEERIIAWTEDARPSASRLQGSKSELAFLEDPRRPDLERLFALEPDIVVADVPRTSAATLEAISSRLPLYRLEAGSMLDVRIELEELGRLIGRVPEARSISFELQAEELRLRSTWSGQKPLRVLVPLQREPWRIVAGQGYAAECLEICGARSPRHDVPEHSARWEPGQLRPQDYDAVLLLTPTFTQEDGEVLSAAPELATTPMRLIDERALLWPGTHSPKGLCVLDEALISLRAQIERRGS